MCEFLSVCLYVVSLCVCVCVCVCLFLRLQGGDGRKKEEMRREGHIT